MLIKKKEVPIKVIT